MTNATCADDAALCASLYQQLLAFYEDQRKRGALHPFVVESLADYTEDRTEALRFYREALAMTEPDEPRHTILFSMAERLIDLGEREQAEACLRDHRAEAEDHNDSDYEQRLKGSCVILPTNQTVQRREPADSLRVKCKRHRRLAPVADLSVGRTD